MDALRILLPCLKTRVKGITPEKPTSFPIDNKSNYVTLSEKADNLSLKPPVSTADEAAASVVSALLNAEKPGRDLAVSLDTIVHQAGGWSEYIAAAILTGVENALKAGSKMNQPMKDAYTKALDAALTMEEFAHEHPILTGVFCTVVALGVLAILTPWILEILGFEALGPVVLESGLQATMMGSLPAHRDHWSRSRSGAPGSRWKRIIDGGIRIELQAYWSRSLLG